ncbi:MAG: hypothetical protein K6E50_07545 [Lachnospiraceae bacterium]|nr:hypothetical protein [Lachnospiraceae bacterium]
MKKQTLRWLSRFMSLILLLVTLPLPELKVFAAEEHYGIWIGNKEFTSEHTTINGDKGTATYNPNSGLVTFDNFENHAGESHEGADGKKYLFYVEDTTDDSDANFVEFTGKATFKSLWMSEYGLGAEAETWLNIASGADITFKMYNTAIDLPEGAVDVYGKLTVDVELDGDSEISAVYASTLENSGTVDVMLKNKSASGNTGSCTGIRCKTYLWNYGKLNLIQDPGDGPVRSGLYVEDRDPHYAKNAQTIMLYGETNVRVNGEDSVAIGANEDNAHGYVVIGGEVFAQGGMYAFMVKALSWDDYMKDLLYIKNPEDGVFSADGRTIFDSEGNVATAVEIAAPEHYGLWVGSTEVTAANCKNIPGIEGTDAKASFDPNTSTLKFEGNVTGVESLHDGAIIEATRFLNIEGNAVLQNANAEDGIRLKDDMTGSVTIYGDIELRAKKNMVNAPKKDLVINGKLKAFNSAEEVGETGVYCKSLTVNKDATLDISAPKGNSTGTLLVAGDMTIEGGSVSVTGMALLYDIIISGNLSMDQGKLEVSSTAAMAAMSVNGKAELKDSVVKVINPFETGGGALQVSKPVFAENSILRAESAGIALTAKDGLYPKNSEVYAASTTDFGIACNFLEMESGKLEAQGATQAIDSKEGFDLKDTVTITDPVGGKIVNKVIVEADGATPAKHVMIDGGTYYKLWVDAKQISDKNASNITFPGGGSASYDPTTKTLTFNGDDTVLINTYFFDSDLNSAGIYAEQDLTIKGKVTINSAEWAPRFAIFVNGNYILTLEDAEVVCPYAHKEGAVDVSSGMLKLQNSRLDTKAAIYAKELVLDKGYIHAEDQGQVKAGVIDVYGDLDLRSGSIEVLETTEDVAGINVSKSFEMDENGTVKVEKNGKGSFAFSAQGGLGMEGGSLTISGNGAGTYGLDQTAVWMANGADINIELTGENAMAADCNSGTFEILDGRFTATVSANGSKGVTADKLLLEKGTFSVESYDLALETEKLQMKGGKLSALSTKTDGQAIKVASGGFELSEGVGIVEPEGGDFNAAGTTVVNKEGKTASKVVLSAEKKYDTEDAVWNLFTTATASFEIAALSSTGERENINAKSAKFYDAKLNGNTITVALKSGVNRKKAAAAANSVLEFDLGEGGTVVYVMPVEYKKPILKLATSSVLIKDGADTLVKTQVLAKTSEGTFLPFPLYGAIVNYGTTAASVDGYGYVQFHASSAGKGAKLSIAMGGWESPIELKFNVKTTTKDVLSSEISQKKKLVLNKNMAGQNYQSQLMLNGQAVTGDKVEVTKGSEVAGITSEGRLFIQAQSETKPGNYNVEISQKGGSAKLKFKVKVSDTALDQAISLKIVQKYDVVTGQPMVLTPVCKDAEFFALGAGVECGKNVAYAETDIAGNIYIAFDDGSLNAKNLNIGDMKITLTSGSSKAVVNLKNVKAKKTTPKVRAAVVNISPDAKGEVKGSVNLQCVYKDAGGNLRVMIPNTVTIGTAKGGEFVVNDYDRTEIDVKSLSGKSGSVKATLTFAGGVTKGVTIKAKAVKKK